MRLLAGLMFCMALGPASAAAANQHFVSGELRKQLDALIDSANQRLDLRLPAFDDEDLRRSLAKAMSRGVKVRLLVAGDAEAGLNASSDLMARGLKVRIFGSGDARFVIADGSRALMGQMDGLPRMLDGAQQSLVSLDEKGICSALQALFSTEWQKSTPAQLEAVKLKKELDALPDPRENEPKFQMKRRSN